MQVLTLPGDQRCLYQHRSMVTCESPITSTSSEPTSNPILVPVSLSLSLSLTHTHTHTHTHTWVLKVPPLLLSSHCVQRSPAQNLVPLWGQTQISGLLPESAPQLLLDFLSKSSLPWDSLKSYGIYLAGFSDLFQRPRFLVYCSFNPLKAFGIFSSFPSSKVSIWSQAGLPQCLWGWGRIWAPATVLSFTSARAKTSAGLTFPGRAKREGCGNPHAPTAALPSAATAACPPRPPPALFLSDPPRRWPQRAAGNRGLFPPCVGLGSAP